MSIKDTLVKFADMNSIDAHWDEDRMCMMLGVRYKAWTNYSPWDPINDVSDEHHMAVNKLIKETV